MAVNAVIHKKISDFSLNIKFESNSRRIGILGASGCGKSMTLKSIAGIETPDEGKIEADHKILFDSEQKINRKPQQRNVGYLFQNYALFPNMTVEQNIAAGIRGSRIEKKKRISQMIERFQLQGLEKRMPGQLSGGQQQRTALARIMAYEPDMILLDEPYSALDMYLKDRLQQELFEMLKNYEGTVIMVSHNRDEIYRFSEELIIMDQGRVVISGKTKELFAKPEKVVAARLTGCKNIAEVHRRDAHHMEIPSWGIAIVTERVIPENTTHIGYRAHDFIPKWGEQNQNCVKVQVQSVADLPFERQYYLKVPGAEEVVCWFVQREDWSLLERRGMPDYLVLSEKKILFLS